MGCPNSVIRDEGSMMSRRCCCITDLRFKAPELLNLIEDVVLGCYTLATLERFSSKCTIQHAFEEDLHSIIVSRDVQKFDRWDDNAASRLFYAVTLQFISDRHPHQGLVVYLFMLSDARIKMVLCAQYYLQLWERYIELKPEGRKLLYHISREAPIVNFLRLSICITTLENIPNKW